MAVIKYTSATRILVCRKHNEQRVWYLVHQTGQGNSGKVHLGDIILPPEFVGKRVRFVMEVIN